MAVELITEGALIDVIGKGFDAGIRLDEAVPPDMIAIPITRLTRSIVVGSPGYFREKTPPLIPQDLAPPSLYPCPDGERPTLSLGSSNDPARA